MPYDSKKRSQAAASEIRDEQGHFTGKVKVTTPAVSESPAAKQDPLDAPLFSFSINNPFKVLLHWLNDIRKKQDTVLDIKIKFPLVVTLSIAALIIGAATSSKVFFDWGKLIGAREIEALPTPTPVIIVKPTATPAPVLTTRLGVLKSTYQLPSAAPSSSESAALSPTVPPSRYVLVGKNGQVIFLSFPSTISVSGYLNKRVLITGYYNEKLNTLSFSSLQDIESLL